MGHGGRARGEEKHNEPTHREGAIQAMLREKLCTVPKWRVKDLHHRPGACLPGVSAYRAAAPSRYTLSSARAVPCGSVGGAPVTSG